MASQQQQTETNVPALFTPLTIRGVTLNNRITISPMCMYSAKDGKANAFHIQHIGSRIIGGAGLFIVEATAVSPEGRISPNDLGLWNDEQIEILKLITDFAHEQKAHIAIQIAHSGRKGSTHRLWESFGREAIPNNEGGWDVIGPSPIPYDDKHKTPKEMTIEEIEGIIQKWIDSAKRAVKAGFDVIEIHGAHGYLLHNFYSPKSNVRTDKYGGSFENRTRLITEIAKGIRANIPEEMPLFVRLSSSDLVEDGWTIEDTVNLSKLLKNVGVDLIDCSSGGNVPAKHNPFTHYQVPYAEKVRKEAEISTGAVGMITDPKKANEIIEQGLADLVLLGRESLREPYWPFKAAKELGYKGIPVPPQYIFGLGKGILF
ncbi:hypothetical protein ABK040_001583 [Willaertia magna]